MSQFRRSFVSLFLFLFVLGLVFFVRTTRATQPPIIINEILVGNAGTNLDPDLTNFSSWIELRNTTGSNISLKGYKLESWPDGAITPDTYLLNKLTVPANGYLLLWADETRKGNHVPIELDMDGGELRLTAPDGSFDHVIFTTAQSMDVSYGRNAGGSWAYFDQSTPGAANTTPDFPANAKANFTRTPDFSVPGGLHTGAITVALSSTTPGATIRYTLDGSRPTSSSPIYSDPLAITTTTMLRARAWAAGLMVSPTATATYLFNIPVNLPVFSIVTDNANLFDNRIGIYVKGTSRKSHSRSKRARPMATTTWTTPSSATSP